MIGQLDQVKREIISEFLSSRVPISRDNLLLLFYKHEIMFRAGYLTKDNRKVLDQAVKAIWEDTFHCEVADPIFNI